MKLKFIITHLVKQNETFRTFLYLRQVLNIQKMSCLLSLCCHCYYFPNNILLLMKNTLFSCLWCMSRSHQAGLSQVSLWLFALASSLNKISCLVQTSMIKTSLCKQSWGILYQVLMVWHGTSAKLFFFFFKSIIHKMLSMPCNDLRPKNRVYKI